MLMEADNHDLRFPAPKFDDKSLLTSNRNWTYQYKTATMGPIKLIKWSWEAVNWYQTASNIQLFLKYYICASISDLVSAD